jgi:hypothetical protein
MQPKIKKQLYFPYYENYKRKFPITDKTIFVFEDTIYTNYEMSYDIYFHELKHLDRMNKIGANKWIMAYLQNKDFRLEEELVAYRYQLKKVREQNDREEYAHILIECANNLSSPLYGNLVSYSEAIGLLKT